MNMLDIKDLSVYYDKVQVLWGVSFGIEEGEVVTLLGSNGAGKSTTVKTIQGLLKSKTGSIRFEDKHIEGLPAYKVVNEGIALVPEGREIFPKMSVLENLVLGAYVPRARAKELREQNPIPVLLVHVLSNTSYCFQMQELFKVFYFIFFKDDRNGEQNFQFGI